MVYSVCAHVNLAVIFVLFGLCNLSLPTLMPFNVYCSGLFNDVCVLRRLSLTRIESGTLISGTFITF